MGIRLLIATAIALVIAAVAFTQGAVAQPNRFTDPDAYCHAVGTVDDPTTDRRYSGPQTTSAIVRAAEVTTDQDDVVVWRCMNGRVLACAAYGPPMCSKAPWLMPGSLDHALSDSGVRAQCRRVRQAQCAAGTHCMVGCASGHPIVNRDSYAVDARGFGAAEWRLVPESNVSLQGTGNSWVLPVQPTGNVSGFFDPSYPPAENRQHLGLDLPVAAGTPVQSPINGSVVVNATPETDIMQSHLILREDGTGVEHVLGHIGSSLRPAQRVTSGQIIGTVRLWPGNPGRSHIHWGANQRGVRAAIGPSPQGDWGWGRAPVAATEAQAGARGWINLNGLLTSSTARQLPSAIRQPVSGADAVRRTLDKHWPGWSAEDRAEGCYEDWRGWMRQGDFNGDGVQDYLVKVRHGENGYVFAFLTQGETFDVRVLEQQPGSSFQNIGLHLARRGESYFDYTRNRMARVTTDSPIVGTCESSSTIFLYRDGQFVAVAQGD
jgi:hypothetical protein